MEDDTVSVSKGVFVFKNNFKLVTKKPFKSARCQNSLLDSDLWYRAFSELWEKLEDQIEILNHKMFSDVLTSLLKYIKCSYNDSIEEIPTAALLTGINMPDHDAQFTTLEKIIKANISEHVVSLYSQDCQNIKSLMENMINQFVNRSSDDELLDCHDQSYIKKTHMNLSVLESWYQNLYEKNNSKGSATKRQKTQDKNVLVVILPDFESFNPLVLQKFILMISWYIKTLPFVFVFGIATSISTLHTFLPYHVTSKIGLKVFHLEPSIVYLNSVLENVFFTLNCPFLLGNKIFNLFTDIFLFYDLSVSNFVQNIKFAMLEHFSYGNAMALCNLNKRVTKTVLATFSHKDCENVRQLMSFRRYVEKQPCCEERIKLLTDDDYFKSVVEEKIVKMQKYIRRIFLFLRCLLILVEDLPKNPLGKRLRELYSVAISKDITKSSEYKECFQLLNFQSKEELCSKLRRIMNYLSNYLRENKTGVLTKYFLQLQEFSEEINNIDMSASEETATETDIESNTDITETKDRKEFREKLLEMSKKTKPLNKYELFRQDLLNFLSNMFGEFLIEPTSLVLHEIFLFDNISIKYYIIGTHRSAIHNALNDPQYYLQCSCCAIPNSTAIKPFMPDICIAYKLHLECGRLINLYDWLQAFLSIVDPTEVEDDTKRVVNPKLQARFTQAVAELEYLGFVKSSKRKADHVTRLTWGG